MTPVDRLQSIEQRSEGADPEGFGTALGFACGTKPRARRLDIVVSRAQNIISALSVRAILLGKLAIVRLIDAGAAHVAQYFMNHLFAGALVRSPDCKRAKCRGQPNALASEQRIRSLSRALNSIFAHKLAGVRTRRQPRLGHKPLVGQNGGSQCFRRARSERCHDVRARVDGTAHFPAKTRNGG